MNVYTTAFKVLSESAERGVWVEKVKDMFVVYLDEGGDFVDVLDLVIDLLREYEFECALDDAPVLVCADRTS